MNQESHLTDPQSTEVWGIVLAAGRSSRWTGPHPKQLAHFEGSTLVRRAASAASGSRLAGTLVVVGFESGGVIRELEALDVEIVANFDFTQGQSASIRAGLARVPPVASAALFLPADQPLLTAAHLDRLIDAYQHVAAGIVIPVHRGRRGAPAIFDRQFFPELFGLTGDTGGRSLFSRHADRILEVEFQSPDPLIDVDTVSDLKDLEARMQRRPRP